MGGSTVSAEDDEITANAELVAADGFAHQILFRDWGDTSPDDDGDGGFETGALVYSNIEEPTMAPFNRMLAPMFANAYVRKWFLLNTAGTVAIGRDVATGWSTPLQAIRITVEGSQAAAVQINVPAEEADSDGLAPDTANEYRGTYFDAPGTFACVGMDVGCVIERADTGTTSFQVADVISATPGLQASEGSWHFTPDPGAMVAVPDQDWILFGAWITTPDDFANGENRVGVFHDGMQVYAYDPDGTEANAPPKGSATYRGAAVGVYKDGTRAAAGLFTARAVLTADYDVAVDDNDNMLSGRIDNFKDTRGFYLGSDTAADPNDPIEGGENDWVVILNKRPILDDGVVAAVDTGVSIGGSADGVRWGENFEADDQGVTTGPAGEWSAQLYGPATSEGSTIPASGVVGQFRAESGNNSVATDPHHRAVVGSFGAEMSDE